MPYLQSFLGPEHGVNPYFPSFEAKKRLLSLKKSILLEIMEKGHLIELGTYFKVYFYGPLVD
jgi:hypothetical protein